MLANAVDRKMACPTEAAMNCECHHRQASVALAQRTSRNIWLVQNPVRRCSPDIICRKFVVKLRKWYARNIKHVSKVLETAQPVEPLQSKFTKKTNSLPAHVEPPEVVHGGCASRLPTPPPADHA